MIQKRFLQSYLEVWAGEQFRHPHIWTSATAADGSTGAGAIWKLCLPLQSEHCSRKGLHPELRRPSPKVSLAQTPPQNERPWAAGGDTLSHVCCVLGCRQRWRKAGDTTADGTADLRLKRPRGFSHAYGFCHWLKYDLRRV